MKIYLIIALILVSSYTGIAQPKNARENLLNLNSGERVAIAPGVTATKKVIQDRKSNISNFLRFYIPSAITSEGIEPAAVSNLNLDFGDDKVKLKWGFSRSKDEERFLKNSFGISASANSFALLYSTLLIINLFAMIINFTYEIWLVLKICSSIVSVSLFIASPIQLLNKPA